MSIATKYQALLDALGLAGREIRSLTIKMRADAPAVIETEENASQKQVDGMARALVANHLVARRLGIGEDVGFQRLQGNVIAWAKARGILDCSTPAAQLLKTMSELGELADATAKYDRAGVVDGLGDVLVTLILYARLQNLDIEECLQSAYDEIKDRKGRMVEGGVFVKDH